MKSLKKAALLCIVSMAATMTGTAGDGRFDVAREQLRTVCERPMPDGTRRMSKQFRRWEWFWESRLMEDGSFPSPGMYRQELARMDRIKGTDRIQAGQVWKELGPEGPANINQNSWYGIGRTNCIAFSRTEPNTMWLGTAHGGLWKTTTAGTAWSEVKIDGWPIFGLSDIAIAPSNGNVIYLATGDADAASSGDMSGYPGFSYGILKSIDGGRTWNQTAMSFELSSNYLVARLWVDPRNPDVVVAATNLGLQRTTDGGATWKLVSSTMYFKDILGNPTDPDVVYATTFSFAGGAQIYRSADAGLTWTAVHSVARGNRIRLAVSKASADVVMALVSDAYTQGLEGVYKSLDHGMSFEKLPVNKHLLGWDPNGQDWNRGGQGFYDLAMEMSPTDADVIYVGGINIWMSTDGGFSWTLSTEQNGYGAPWVHADHHFLAYHPTQPWLYSCHDGGIARTTDKGATWRDMSAGLRIQQYYSLATSDVNPNVMLAGAQDNATTVFNGTAGRHVIGGDGMECAIDPKNPQTMYASIYYGTFYRSTNGGSNWAIISRQDSRQDTGAWVAPFVVDPQAPSTVYAGYKNVWRSTDRGQSWTKISLFNVNQTLRTLAVAPSDSRYIYAGFSSRLYYSTDGGSTWTSQAGIGGYITDIEVDPDDPTHVIISQGGFVGSSKVLEIRNGTVTNITGNGLPNVPANAIVYQPGNPDRVFAGTDLGVFYREEGSNSWVAYGTGGPTTIVTDMELIPSMSKMRVATYGRGIWEVDVTQCAASTPSVQALTSTTVCAGDTVVLQAGEGYKSYRWSNGDTTRTIRLATVAQSGDYLVSVEDGQGCRALSQTIAVTIRRVPVRPIISAKNRDTLRSSSIGVAKYQWFVDGQIIDGATQREYIPTKHGSYTVRVENTDGCTTFSDPYLYGITSVAEGAGSAGGTVSIYPNPVHDALTLALPGSGDVVRNIDIVNVAGSTIVSSMTTMPTERMDVSALSPGTYYVRVRCGRGVWMTTFVKY